jgi:hypothetical protein
LVALNTFNDGYSSYFITNIRGYDAMRAAHYTRGVNPQQCPRMVSFPTGSEMRELFCFDGIPVLVLDFITIAANLTSIWLVTFGPNGLHGIVPASVGQSMFVVRSTILPDDTKLVYHVTMPVGLALGSLCALARIKNALV